MDRKVKVGIDDCLPGLVTAETIYNKYGAVIIWENTMLDGPAINRLKEFGIDAIRVYESSLSRIQEKTRAERLSSAARAEDIPFTEAYKKDADEFRSVLQDLSTGKTASLSKTVEIAKSIYSRNNDHREIIDCVTQIRNVDEYTYYHCINVSLLAMLIGKWLKLASDDIYMLIQAGLLHDIGKSYMEMSLQSRFGGPAFCMISERA